MRIAALMAIVVVASATGCPGFEAQKDQAQDQKDARRKDQKPNETALGPGPRYPQGEACRDRPVRKIAILDAVRASTVRIESESVSGSGFVLASPRGELLVVTSAHFGDDEERIRAFVTTASGETLEVGLEMAMDDPRSNLAILHAPRMADAPTGLRVNAAGARLNQDVVALSYRAAGAAANLSFEPARISALGLSFEGGSYLQTATDIDPGDDGGPVVDACGAVVGMAVAVHSDTRRLGLIVPAERVLALHDRYVAPAENPGTRIRSRTAMLEQSLKQQRGDVASEVFSRQFLRENVWGDFIAALQQAKTQEERYAGEMRKAGMVYADEPFEKRAQFLSGLLPRAQYTAWYVGQAIDLHLMTKYAGLRRCLAASALLPGVFGGMTSLQVMDVIKESEAVAVARVQIASRRGTKVYDFQWKLESGDWHIARLTCVSGCHK